MNIPLYRLIGHPVEGLTLAARHREQFIKDGKLVHWAAVDVAPVLLSAKLPYFLTHTAGVAITAPYTRETVSFMERLGHEAFLYQRVDTVLPFPTGAAGDFVAPAAFRAAAAACGLSLSGDVVIFGSGEAARLAAGECARAGMTVQIFALLEERDAAKKLAAFVQKLVPTADCAVTETVPETAAVGIFAAETPYESGELCAAAEHFSGTAEINLWSDHPLLSGAGVFCGRGEFETALVAAAHRIWADTVSN